LATSLDDYGSLLVSFKTAQEDYTAKSTVAKTKRDEYEAFNKAYLDEQAGILAAELEVGRPCPVCGSIEHPEPAVLSPKAPTKVVLDKAKLSAETADSDMVTTSGLANNLGGQIDTKQDEIKVTAASLLGETPFDNISVVLKSAISDLETRLTGINGQLEEQEKE
jgi:exonuclease SbcC